MKLQYIRNSICLAFFLNLICINAQTKNITGIIIDETGGVLPGVNIIEKGTSNGTSSNMDGQYTLQLRNDSAVLEFSYIGFKTQEITVGNVVRIDIQLELDAQALDEIEITGIRASQLRSVKVKREAATVIEAITPEDIGSFSDDNVADALQRVAGVQIERNVDGVSGDRVSIRGIGPQFVGVTVNGRTPLSAGNEGRSDMRKFNLNTVPTEVISGARIHKTTQAKEITTSIGGSVDLKTLRPLNLKYKRGKNYFGSIQVRGTSNTEFEDIDLNSRISGVIGGKISDKLAVFVNAVYSDEQFYRDEASFRNYREEDVKVDSNDNGIWDAAEGDQLYESMLIPVTLNNSTIKDSREHIAGSLGIQWKPSEKLDIMLDYSLSRLKNDSQRQLFQINLAAGGNNGLFGDNNVFGSEGIGFNGNNFQFLDASSVSHSAVTIVNRNVFYDNHTTNNMAGLNFKYHPIKKITIDVDLSYSNLDFFQDLKNAGTNRLNAAEFDQSDINFDIRGVLPQYGLPDEIYDPSKFLLLNSALRQIRTKGDNYASRIDVDYIISKNSTLSFGIRYAITDFETREGSINSNAYGGYTDEEQADFIRLRSVENNLISPDFLYGETGLKNWISTPGEQVLAYTPELATMNGGGIFNFSTPLKDVTSDEGDLLFGTAQSFGAEESSYASYAQLDTKIKLFNIPVAMNFGLRAVNTSNVSRGFSGVTYKDPIEETTLQGDSALYHEVSNSRWDVMPSFNANFTIKRNFNYRIGISRGVSRPRYTHMVPRNTITFLDPNSEIFDPNSSEYVSDLSQSVYRGTISSGNPELKPYSAWMFDNTFELYSKNGGAAIASVFYKRIQNYIGTQSFVDQVYPGEELLGIAIPEGQEDLLFDITQPVNITDAYMLGFEIGFNQHFYFLPGFANGFGMQANYTHIKSSFDGAVGDATNGFPGTSPNNFNSVLYYEKYGFSFRFTAAYRDNYLSNLGGVGSTRADESHYTQATTILGVSLKYKILKSLIASAGVNNFTGEDTRRYVGDDTRNLTAYYNRVPVWKVGLRYKL